MTLLSPGMLWVGLLAVPLVAVYLLKVRPTRKPTTTLFLWEQIIQESRTRVLLRRLRDLLSLLLMVAALAALVMAMAEPMTKDQQDTRDVVLLIDNSRSMGAADGGASRLDVARDRAKDIIDALGLQRRAAVATVAREVRGRVGLTRDQRALIDALDEIRPSDEAFRPDALSEYLGEQQPQRACRVILISDGCFPGADQLKRPELIRLGSPAENIGITAFDMVRMPGGGGRVGLFFRLASSFKQPRSVDVVLSHESQQSVIKVCPVTVTPGLGAAERFLVDGPTWGRWILRLDHEDALARDDRAFAVLPPHSPIRVSVHSDRGEFFLNQCVRAFSGDEGLLELTSAAGDLTLCLGTAAAEADKCIVFAPRGDSPFWQAIGDEVSEGAVEALAPDHPAVQFCDLEAISFVGQRDITPPEGAVVLARSAAGTPLIYKAAAAGRTAYVINMDPEEAEFFLSAYFPVIVYSMARDLTGRSPRRDVSIAPGETVSTPASAGASLVLTTPGGATRRLSSGRPARLRELGFYKLDQGDETRPIACSPQSANESLLDNEPIPSTAGPIRTSRSPRYLLTVLGLLILVTEGVLYHRRRVG